MAVRPAGRAFGPARLLVAVLLASLAPGPVHAGHEMPFYPSFYPQEITLDTLTPAAAGPRLARGQLHAYVGEDPFAGRPLPGNVASVESLAGYVVVTLNPDTAPRDAPARCALARRLAARLAPGRWIAHPYPVTPYHPDYLQHADLARATAAAPPRDAATPAAGLRLRARGAPAQALAPAARASGGWDGEVEVVPLARLLEAAATTFDGWTAPPWLKAGWYHAHLLLAPAMRDRTAREAADGVAHRLMQGGGAAAERLDAQRALVRRLTAGCERIVAGYVLRREAFNVEYSGGVENVAWDAHAGLAAGIFLRTVKLKDFPWNGWLALGLPGRATAAWNPVGGFTDATGRVLWAALGDPALLPEPQGGGWIANRVRVQGGGGPAAGTEAIPVPADALLPEAGTGRLREVGPGRTARARLTYRVLASAFHDGTATTPADLLHAFAMAFAWGGAAPGAGGADPHVARATTLMRQWLVGVRVLRVDRDVLRFGDVQMDYDVPVVEVYLAHPGAEGAAAAVAPPWTTVPWHVLALLDEAARRGWGALSAEAAARGRRPWLDLVRDPVLGRRLAGLVDDLAARRFVPEPLRGRVTEAEAAARWTALRRFHAAHRHWLVTNGPYQVHAWAPGRTVLRVVRDFSYPLGVGSFNAYPLPVRGRVTRAEAHDRVLTVAAEVERVERFGRAYTVTAGPLGRDWPERDRAAVPHCRFVLLAADGTVVAAGALPPTADGTFAVPLDAGRGAAPPHTALVAVVVNDNLVGVDVTRVPLGR